MTKPKNPRSRRESLTLTVQSREEAAEQIKRMGDLQRGIGRIQADLNDQVAVMQEQADAAVAPMFDEIKAIEAAVHAWAEANRDTLTDGGKVKTADLTTGVIKWRTNPPRCTVTGTEAVLALLESDPDLIRFVRIKKEVNKDAVLNESAFFETNPVPGLKIQQGKEFFVIEPFNQELAS